MTSLPALLAMLAGMISPLGSMNPDSLAEAAVAARVEIVRTEYGVPHILAEDLEAMGFALAWVQSEDHGDVVARALVQARGENARHLGHDSIDGDFVAKEIHDLAVQTHDLLDDATRRVYAGFAAGVNHYVRLHRSEFPDWMPADFTPYDAHSRDVQSWSRGDAASFVRRLSSGPGAGAAGNDDGYALDGSNAWAFHGSRTTTGHTLLLRNPHLAWTAGYYEAHVRVPGVVDFYGDFRIGGAFGIIGGFNRHLGWATTNNYPRYSQVYAFSVDPSLPEHYVLDGRSHPLQQRTTTVDYRTADGVMASESRAQAWTPFGPVIHAAGDWIYVLKDPRHGEFRRGEQFLRMMRSSSLEEWLDVMRMRAHPSSNFTYADAAGNIAHLYNARLPALPHPVTGDTAAVARSTGDIWSEQVPFDDLPLYVNPQGGYVQQANDTPDYTTLHVPMDRDTMPHNLPEPRLRLRSQLSLELVHGDTRLSLEDMVELKHSPRMLMAERVVDDLIAAVAATRPSGSLAQALDVLRGWDRTARADSRGGMLFQAWVGQYQDHLYGDTARFYREPWSPERPMETPRGLGDPEAAVTALTAATDLLEGMDIPLDARWGDIHRVVRGQVDEPVSGCGAALGCFRTLSFERNTDGRLAANRGDGWVLAVEFADIPRAYSVLAYGQSPLETSAHHDDQARLFAQGRMKPVAFTDADIAAATIRRYRPSKP